MRTIIPLPVVIICGILAFSRPIGDVTTKTIPDDKQLLQGDWRVIRLTIENDTIVTPPDRRVIYRFHSSQLEVFSGADGEESLVDRSALTYSINPDLAPKTIDIYSDLPPPNNLASLGIYQFTNDNNHLVIKQTKTGITRPSTFSDDPTGESCFVVLHLQRVNKK